MSCDCDKDVPSTSLKLEHADFVFFYNDSFVVCLVHVTTLEFTSTQNKRGT